MSNQSDDPNICTKCIGSGQFSTWIQEHGVAGECEIDSDHDGEFVVAVSVFAIEVDRWFRETYVEGADGWGSSEDSDNPVHFQHGEPFEAILSEELYCEEDTLNLVIKHLPDISDHDFAQGSEPFYTDRNYETIAEALDREQKEQADYWYENRFHYQWKDFCKRVQFERRFFDLKEPLDELFGPDPTAYEQGAIAPVYTLAPGLKLYRARLLGNGLDEEKLAKDAEKELGAPPVDRAQAGRMNVEFIPAFYAAFNTEIAVAEIRPGIGENVAVGEFVLQRGLKVFDFTAFSTAARERRHGGFSHTRYEFISQMEDEISEPVHASDKQREYIPTQIIAEYIARHMKCDAVIYRSSMIRDREKENRNIVLINRGAPFTGAPEAPLSYSSFSIKIVTDIKYQIDDQLF